MLQNRFLSFSIIISLGFLLLVSLGISAIIEGLSNRLKAAYPDITVVIFYIINLLLTLFISALIFAVIFRVLPDAKIRWKDVAAGAIATAVLAFGGVDLIVNNAGLSISKTIADHTEKDWDLLYDVLVKGQFFVTQAAVAVMKKQAIGGDVINIVSKNALVSGPNNAGYGSAKAAQLHLSRLNAAELGADKIRVNVINPDAVISDSNIWAGGWAEGRAKAYGITVAELPAYYAKRTLLNEVILPDDIANACVAFAGGLLNKSTGNVLNVDGGVAAAFVR